MTIFIKVGRETQIYVMLYVQRFSRTYRHVCLVHNSAQHTHFHRGRKLTQKKHKQIKAHEKCHDKANF